MSGETDKGTPISNFAKAIVLVIVAIVAIRLLSGVISFIFGLVVTAVIVVAVGALIFGVVGALRRK